MKINFFLVFLFLSTSSFASDIEQNLPDQIQDDNYYQNNLKNVEGGSSYLEGGANEIDLSKYPDAKNDLLDDPNYYDQKFSKDSGHSLESKNNNNPQVMEYKDSDLTKEVHNQGQSVFSFGYFFKGYEVSDPGLIYDKTYKNNTGSQESGIIHLSGDKVVYKSAFDVNLGFNLGLSFAQGKARFVGSQTESNAVFSMWMVPLDFSLGLALPVTSWVKLRVAAGPSVMGIMQSRSDKKSAEKHKRRRQVGRGYFFEGQFDFSLSRLFPSLGKSLIGEYGVSQYFISTIVRTQKYSNFQDNFEFSGSSVGLLMTFEYL